MILEHLKQIKFHNLNYLSFQIAAIKVNIIIQKS